MKKLNLLLLLALACAPATAANRNLISSALTTTWQLCQDPFKFNQRHVDRVKSDLEFYKESFLDNLKEDLSGQIAIEGINRAVREDIAKISPYLDAAPHSCREIELHCTKSINTMQGLYEGSSNALGYSTEEYKLSSLKLGTTFAIVSTGLAILARPVCNTFFEANPLSVKIIGALGILGLGSVFISQKESRKHLKQQLEDTVNSIKTFTETNAPADIDKTSFKDGCQGGQPLIDSQTTHDNLASAISNKEGKRERAIKFLRMLMPDSENLATRHAAIDALYKIYPDSNQVIINCLEQQNQTVLKFQRLNFTQNPLFYLSTIAATLASIKLWKGCV